LTDGGEGVCYWQGKHLSEETKRKISKSHIGMKYSEEFKIKMLKIVTGRHCSNEIRAKISKSRIGICHSEETLEKLRNRIPWNRGKSVGSDAAKKAHETRRRNLMLKQMGLIENCDRMVHRRLLSKNNVYLRVDV